MSRPPIVRATAVALTVLVWAASFAAAHEFWIEPPGRAEAGARLDFTLRVGDGFPGETYPRNPAHIVRFELIDPRGERRAIEGRRGRHPAGSIRAETPGTHVAVYRSRSTRTTLDGDVFQRYLREEGLERIAAERDRRGLAARAATERFSRCAKSVFAVDRPGGEAATRPTGLRFELVPDLDPLGLAPGGTLGVRALLDGRPVEDVRVHAFRRGDDGEPASARTDAEGRVRFTIDAVGVWMFAGVQMRAGAADDDAEWFSEWASLTFAVEPAP